MPYVIFLLICSIWGSSFILMKKASMAFTPLGVGAGRVFGGAVVLAAIWRLSRLRWTLAKRDVAPVLFVVMVGYALPYVLQPLLVERHGSAFIAMTVSFVPLATIVVSIPWLGVWPTMRQLLGVGGGLLCMGALAADGLNRRVPPADMLLAASVPLSYALANCCIRRQLRRLTSLELSLGSLALTSTVLLPLACVAPGKANADENDLPLAVFSLVVLGVLGTGLGTYLFNKLIREQGPLFAGMVTYLVPIAALAWGWIDQEKVTTLQLAALAGVLAMVAVVQVGAAATAVPGEEITCAD
ncbi:MAG TPA: DMT family transporter [Pirellulales bacterium]|nr:DMT family transporter [Pirellulales bacterium]